MSEIKPLRPDEILSNLAKTTPPVVITAVNNMLTKHFKGGSVTIKQDEIVSEILRLSPNISRHEVFENKWMDFEEVYRQFGWSVTYDKPGYNESYDATFEFKPRMSVVK
jgi:hypothetical protein